MLTSVGSPGGPGGREERMQIYQRYDDVECKERPNGGILSTTCQ